MTTNLPTQTSFTPREIVGELDPVGLRRCDVDRTGTACRHRDVDGDGRADAGACRRDERRRVVRPVPRVVLDLDV